MLCSRIKIGVVQLVSNHHEIDVAVGRISLLRNRSVDEGGLDPVGVWFEELVNFEGFFDWLGQANGLLDECSQLLEDGRALVCSVVLLIADALDGYEPATLQL